MATKSLVIAGVTDQEQGQLDYQLRTKAFDPSFILPYQSLKFDASFSDQFTNRSQLTPEQLRQQLERWERQYQRLLMLADPAPLLGILPRLVALYDRVDRPQEAVAHAEEWQRLAQIRSDREGEATARVVAEEVARPGARGEHVPLAVRLARRNHVFETLNIDPEALPDLALVTYNQMVILQQAGRLLSIDEIDGAIATIVREEFLGELVDQSHIRGALFNIPLRRVGSTGQFRGLVFFNKGEPPQTALEAALELTGEAAQRENFASPLHWSYTRRHLDPETPSRDLGTVLRPTPEELPLLVSRVRACMIARASELGEVPINALEVVGEQLPSGNWVMAAPRLYEEGVPEDSAPDGSTILGLFLCDEVVRVGSGEAVPAGEYIIKWGHPPAAGEEGLLGFMAADGQTRWIGSLIQEDIDGDLGPYFFLLTHNSPACIWWPARTVGGKIVLRKTCFFE